MKVYKFNKSYLDRLEESMQVLSWKDEILPASSILNEWAVYIELQIEPTGWQAMWKLPRVICEEFNVRFPTIVFGMVEQVLFKELKAIFLVESVQDDVVQLPERHEVFLVDLWVTENQLNTELNIERTADCCDRLRFFYTNVWMPWDDDNDDDLNWPEKYLESRIRFSYDLTRKSMKRPLAAHIRTLLTEARYLQERREYIELGLSDNEEDMNESLNKSRITDLMRLHLRMTMIRSEIEMLENPELRRIYEEVKFDDEKYLKNADNLAISAGKKKVAIEKPRNMCYVATNVADMQQQLKWLSEAMIIIPINSSVKIYSSLESILKDCLASDSIYLSPGRHNMKFLEYLNGNGSINGLVSNKLQPVTALSKPDTAKDVIISTTDDDSILLIFDGDFTLCDLLLDCSNTHTGISIKNGNVLLKNCRLVGNKKSLQQGIVCHAYANLKMENCVVENFETGIHLNEGAHLELKCCTIYNCKTGLEAAVKETKITFRNSTIEKAAKCGIFVDQLPFKNANEKNATMKDLADLKALSTIDLQWNGSCNFKNCKKNLFAENCAQSIISGDTLEYVLEEHATFCDENEDDMEEVNFKVGDTNGDDDVIIDFIDEC